MPLSPAFVLATLWTAAAQPLQMSALEAAGFIAANGGVLELLAEPIRGFAVPIRPGAVVVEGVIVPAELAAYDAIYGCGAGSRAIEQQREILAKYFAAWGRVYRAVKDERASLAAEAAAEAELAAVAEMDADTYAANRRTFEHWYPEEAARLEAEPPPRTSINDGAGALAVLVGHELVDGRQLPGRVAMQIVPTVPPLEPYVLRIGVTISLAPAAAREIAGELLEQAAIAERELRKSVRA